MLDISYLYFAINIVVIFNIIFHCGLNLTLLGVVLKIPSFTFSFLEYLYQVLIARNMILHTNIFTLFHCWG